MPTIRAGNTVIIKPSPLIPLGTLRLIEILEAPLLPSVLNAVAGGDEIGPLLTGYPPRRQDRLHRIDRDRAG